MTDRLAYWYNYAAAGHSVLESKGAAQPACPACVRMPLSLPADSESVPAALPRRDLRWQTFDWAVLALLFGAVVFFHARGLRPGYAFLPIDNVRDNLPWRSGPYQLGSLQNPLIGDPIYQFYPLLTHAVQVLRTWSWPLWHAQWLLGHPLVGDPLAQTFYPVFLFLGRLLGAARGLTVGFALHACLAAGLTYAWLRTLTLNRAAAALGALTYALGGYLVTWFETPFWVSTLSWLPGVLWMTELALARRQWRFVAGGAVALGLALLAGQVSFVVGFDLFLGIYLAGRLLDPDVHPSPWGWPLLSGAVMIGLGMLLGAAQWVPFAEQLALSHRTGGGATFVLPWRQVITWIVPDFYGNPSTTRAYWGAINFSEAVVYAGGAAWCLALTALGGARRRQAWPLGLTVAGLAYLVLGGPGVPWLAQQPFFKLLNFGRMAFLLPLLIAALAALALDTAQIRGRVLAGAAGGLLALLLWAVVGNWGEARSHWLDVAGPVYRAAGLVLGTVGLLWLRGVWPAQQARLNWLLTGLVLVDLYTFGSRYNPAAPVADLPAPTPAIEYLQANAGLYRVATQQRGGEFIFGPNYLSVFGVADLSGYSSLLPARLVQLVTAGDPASMGYNSNTIWLGQPSLRLLDLLQARYLVSETPLPDPLLKTDYANYGCDLSGAEVTAAQPAAGQVTVRDTAINRLDLVFRVTGTSAPVVVRMWQGSDRARLVLESAVAGDQLRDQQTATYFFASETNAPGQTYTWEVSTAADHSQVAVCETADGRPALALYGTEWAAVYSGEIQIAERLAPLPRAYVVFAVEQAADEAAMLGRVLDPAFDLRNTAVTLAAVDLPAPPVPQSAVPAQVVSYSDTQVNLRTATNAPGLLVLGDAEYPGWEARVDGQVVPIVRVNWLWRGVVLPAGDHTVGFRYAPASVRTGLLLTGLGLLLVLGLVGMDGGLLRRR